MLYSDAAGYVNNPAGLPLEFDYCGVHYKGLGDGFAITGTQSYNYCDHTQYTVTATHVASGALFTVYINDYETYNACSFRAIIKADKGTDVFVLPHWQVSHSAKTAVISGNYGDNSAHNLAGYLPFSTDLTKEELHQKTTGGRPTHKFFPYYYLDTDEGSSIFILSWQGCWHVDACLENGAVTLSGGQNDIATKLFPGETLRLPMVMVMDYTEDPINTWRHFYIDCLMRRPGGFLPKPMMTISTGAWTGPTDELMRTQKQWYDENLPFYDGWSCGCNNYSDGTGYGNKTRNWLHSASLDLNKEEFKDGLRWIGRDFRRENRQFVWWNECELVRTPKEDMDKFFAFYKDFKPEWFLGDGSEKYGCYDLYYNLLDLGNPECLAFIEEHLFKVMDEVGATIFRIDFNTDPAVMWRRHDVPGRTGIVENKYCQGYLQMLEDVSKRYGCLMDTCASGGGRNDLETLCYSVPLQYSDHVDSGHTEAQWHIVMQQIVWRWVPYFRNTFYHEADEKDIYLRRSLYTSFATMIHMANSQATPDKKAIADMMYEWRDVGEYYYGEYYELCPPEYTDEHPQAFEFYDKMKHAGVVRIYLPEKGDGGVTVQLKGLPEGFTLTDADGKPFVLNGCTLTVEDTPRTARILYIKG